MLRQSFQPSKARGSARAFNALALTMTTSLLVMLRSRGTRGLSKVRAYLRLGAELFLIASPALLDVHGGSAAKWSWSCPLQGVFQCVKRILHFTFVQDGMC